MRGSKDVFICGSLGKRNLCLTGSNRFIVWPGFFEWLLVMQELENAKNTAHEYVHFLHIRIYSFTDLFSFDKHGV